MELLCCKRSKRKSSLNYFGAKSLSEMIHGRCYRNAMLNVDATQLDVRNAYYVCKHSLRVILFGINFKIQLAS